MATVKLFHDEPGTKPAEPCPTFGPCPNTDVADFNFQQEESIPLSLI